MNQYRKLKNEHQRRVNALPIKFAFSNEQFREAMAALGLSENDLDKIYTFRGTGGFYRRTDAQMIHETFKQNEREMKEAIAADKDGTGFIRDMFRYELANHEYCITFDLEPTLDALGLTADEVNASPALLNGLRLAKRDYLDEADRNGWY